MVSRAARRSLKINAFRARLAKSSWNKTSSKHNAQIIFGLAHPGRVRTLTAGRVCLSTFNIPPLIIIQMRFASINAKPYSRPARSRCEFGGERSHLWATAALFGVSVASVVKWSQRWRASGSAAAKPMGGRRPLRLASECAWLLARIAEKPDLTLRAMMAELAERGTPASYGAVWRFFQHEGITFKKACTPASRIVPTSPAAGPLETHQRRSTPSGWRLSTRLGPRPT